MEKGLKRLFLIAVILSIPVGLFTKHEHAIFLWHKVPCFEAIFGALGAILLVSMVKLLGNLIRKREDFYD